MREPADASELLQYCELTEIRVYEVAGRRLPDDLEASPGDDFGVQAIGDSDSFETRARLHLRTEHSEFVAEVGAVYTFSEPLRVNKPVAQEFMARVGVMAVYPFIREQIFSSARRLGVPSPVLGLLRAGQFVISDNEDAAVSGATPVDN